MDTNKAAVIEAGLLASKARGALRYAKLSGKYAFVDNERFISVQGTKLAPTHVKLLATGCWKPLSVNTVIDVR